MNNLNTRLGPPLARLQGKTALITGAGSVGDDIGIGKAIALLFAREGAQVGVVDMQAERAEQTRDDIIQQGGDAIALPADVTRGEQCEKIIASTLAHFGKLDILVNNVGIAGGGGPIESLDESMWQKVIDVNLKSAMLMCKYALPALKKKGGAIINIASISGIRAMGAGAAYGPSKAALIMFTRELAAMYGRDGLRANVVAPGHIYSPMVANFFTPAMREARRKVSPLGFEADVWDVALATLYLASDEARFITGVCLPVDGGVSELGGLLANQLINE